MKKINLFSFVLLFVGIGVFSGCDLRDPGEYNDEVLDHYTEMDDQIVEFLGAIWDDDYTVEDLQAEYDKALDVYKKNYDDLEAIEPMSKDPGFHTSVVDFYDICKDVLDNEYKEIMDMYSVEWQESFGAEINDLDEIAVEKIIDGEDDVIDSQIGFADNYGFELY
jgi:hypothetical protein